MWVNFSFIFLPFLVQGCTARSWLFLFYVLPLREQRRVRENLIKEESLDKWMGAGHTRAGPVWSVLFGNQPALNTRNHPTSCLISMVSLLSALGCQPLSSSSVFLHVPHSVPCRAHALCRFPWTGAAMCLFIYPFSKDLCAYSGPCLRPWWWAEQGHSLPSGRILLGRMVNSVSNFQRLGSGLCWSKCVELGGQVKESGTNVA